jgi:tetratricopeptide (TPR) repeat protein
MRGNNRNLRAIQIALIVVLSWVVYFNALGNGFIWDDRLLIVENESIKEWRHLATNLTSDFFYFDKSPLIKEKKGYYRPLITLSYMVDYTLWGLNPLGYHFTNIFFHSLNALLVYLIMVTLVPKSKLSPLLAGLFFASHPIHTESVTWIAGRTDVLATTFFLLSLWLYMHRFSPGEKGLNPINQPKWYFLSLGSFTLALLAKESSLVLPLVLVVYEYYFIRLKSLEEAKRLIPRLLPFLAITLLYLLCRFWLLGIKAPINPYLAQKGTYQIFITFIKALGLYIEKLVFPHPLNAYYSMPVSTSFFEPQVIIPTIVLLGLLLFLWKWGNKANLFSFSCLFFLLTLLPVSNLIPIGALKDMGFFMAERFLYLPSVAFCIALAAIIANILSTSHYFSRPWIVSSSIAIILLSFYFTATVLRNFTWQDEITFYQDTLSKAPFASLLHYNLALSCRDKELWDLAEQELKETIRLDNTRSEAHNNLGNIYFIKGEYEKSLTEWQKAVKLNPSNYQAWYNLAKALDKANRKEEALKAYQYFLRTAPPSYQDIIRQVKQRIELLEAGG